MTLTRLAHTIVLAWGWRRILIAFLAGAISALALPPTNIWPIPFITFPILVWLVDGAAAGRLGGVLAAATAGWWFGFGYFLAGLYWIGHAFLVDAKTFGWLLPLAVVALPAGMAVYTAFGLALARLIWVRGPARVLALAVAFTLAEWLRGHLFSGFPWNTYGYALISPLWLAQGAALVGIWGLTFLAVAVYASPAVLADDRADTRRPWLAPALSVAVIAALAAYGAWRLATHADKLCRGRAPAHHAAQPAAGREVQLFAEAAGHEPLSRAVGSRQRSAIDGRARRHPPDLAGIRVPVLSHARTRGARPDRGAAAAGNGVDHGRNSSARNHARSQHPSRL